LLAIHEVHAEVIVTSFSVWTDYISGIYKSPLAMHTHKIHGKKAILLLHPALKTAGKFNTRTALEIAYMNNESRDLQAGYKRTSDCLQI